MRIGIVEVCEPNHYTAVLALAHTYSINPENEITIFTSIEIKPLLSELGSGIKIQTVSESQSIQEFLASIAQYPLDRIHINTISKYYKEFSTTNWPAGLYFSVHNIDLWYDTSFLKRGRTFLADLKGYFSKKTSLRQTLILYVKDFWRQSYRNTFIKNISKGNYKIVVYSRSQKKHLEKYIDLNRILAFPFCIHTTFNDLSNQGNKLRICIPGSVSNLRRNYSELLEMFYKQLSPVKNKIILDLLGYIPEDNRFLIVDINELISKGFSIDYNEGFIDSHEFDQRLSKCDIILGNLKVQMNVFRKYGETKETGILFNIIKSGKPGIFPYEYPIDEELTDICLFFKNYTDLGDLILRMIDHPEIIANLKAKSRLAVKQYSPENLYHLLQE